MVSQSTFIQYLTELGLNPAEINSLVNTINQQAQQGGADPIFEMPDFTKIPTEKIESYKALLKQVSCDEIPNDGFSPEDLDKVKSCVKAVTPIETEDFNPPLLDERGEPILAGDDQKEQFAQAECLGAATEAAKKIVLAEQRKTPNAIKYAALRGKVQELRDNLVPIKEYFTERYNIFTNVVEQVRPFTSEFLYWEDEFNRLSNVVNSAKTAANDSTISTVLDEIIDTLDERSRGNYLELPLVRNAFSSLASDLSNFNQFLTGIGLDSTTVSLYSSYKQSILNSNPIKNLIIAIKGKVEAYSNRLVAKNNAISTQSQRIQSYAQLSGIEGVTKAGIQSIINNISQQIIVRFSTFQTNEEPIAPKNMAAFSFRLIDKFFTTLRVTQYDSNDEPITGPDGKTLQADETFQIYGNPVLQNNVFENRQGLSIVGVNIWPADQNTYPSDTYDPATDSWTVSRFYRDYSLLTGLLYNGVSGNPYIGLYNRLAKPIKYLFTLQERGLTLNANQIDPSLAGIEGAPLTYTEDNVQYYISNISNYESFYDILPVQYPIRVDRERNNIYPQAIATHLTQLRSIAAREAADIFRQDPESALKLARPVSYTSSPGSSVFSQGTFEYSTLDPILSDSLLYYTETYNKINELITQCDSELDRLSVKVKENSMDEETLKEKLSAIPCFSKAAAATEASNQQQDPTDPNDPNAGTGTGQESCAQKTARKRATDPLYLKTLTGTDTSLPDITSQCYWKEFAKALNKVSILPFPDLSGPPPNNFGFRYWPISCILPIPFGLVLLPIPPIWRSLFTIPTPLGTLVCFLTFPIAPIGIPLPSIYIFFFAIDGNKYLALATNVPILYAPPTNLKFGFIQDNSSKSANPLGLVPTNPFRGQPLKGALVAPLALNAITAKARRLASLSAMLASGKPYITNLSGEKLPVDIKLKDLFNSMPSEAEQMMSIASALPTGDFSRQMDQFKITINRQLDKLGVTPIAPIQALKRQVEQKREAEEAKAFQETEPSTRRKKRKEARNIKLKNLNDKINATKQIMNAHLDNIKLGTIRYPKDPTKFNPELPSAFTALLDIIELAVTGDLKVEGSATDLGNQLTSIISKINPRSLSTKRRLNLKDPADFTEFKNALKKLTGKTVDYLGGKSFTPNTTGAKTQAEAQEIAESEKAMQDKLVKAISLTAAALAVPISLNIFDFGKKCCDVQAKNVLSTVPIPVQLAFTLITSLLESLIDALTPSVAIKTLGLGKNATIDISQVGTMLEKMIQKIPKVKLPDPASIQILIMALIIPILSIISLPKAPAPLHPPIIPIVVPLDPILKPLIKKALGAVVDGSFKLLDAAGNAVMAAEIEAKAEAEAQAAAAGLQGNSGGSGATAGTGSGTGGTGIGTGVGTAATGQQNSNANTSGSGANSTTSAGTLNSTLGNEYSASEKIVKKIFKTACGDTGITATLALESRIELNEILNTIKNPDSNINELLNQSAGLEAEALNQAKNAGNYAGYQNTLKGASAQFSQSFEATSKSKVILSIETPDGERFDLPEMPFAALDIGGNFDLLTGADIVEMIRSILNSVFDKLIKPIATIVDIISLLSLSLNTFSYTTVEASIPYVNIIKLILMAIDAIIPAGIKLKSANLEAMELIKNTLIKGLLTIEPGLKEIAWIASLALCAFSSTANNFSFTTIARLFHPIMNQDDLPPWERLTHKNPLFAIFLDEIAWRGSLYATGSLIFQSKTPAVLPYSPLLPIVHIPIHTIQPN